MAKVGVRGVPPKGRDLVLGLIVPDDDGAETVLVDRAREKSLDSLRPSVGRQVPVGRLASKERVAQAIEALR